MIYLIGPGRKKRLLTTAHGTCSLTYRRNTLLKFPTAENMGASTSPSIGEIFTKEYNNTVFRGIESAAIHSRRHILEPVPI